MIVVSLYYKTENLRDVILHHAVFIAVTVFMETPIPQYSWLCVACALSLESTTLFLNGQFLSKWYKLSDSTVLKFKWSFAISWFLVRVPILSIAIPIFFYKNWRQILQEWPMYKFIGSVIGFAAIWVMNNIWTVMIVKKMYRILLEEDNNVKAMDSFDLVSAEDGKDHNVGNGSKEK